ncbi:hypothetical protein [Aeromonas hydrophila]|uniref:hypothetical protein n=1 Tax=Aeromonas hydrophila TaxID=644 RepID=UPI003EC8C625
MENFKVEVQITEAAKNMTSKQLADAIADKFGDLWPMFYGATVKNRGDYYVVSPYDDGEDSCGQSIRVYKDKIAVNEGKKELAMIQLINGIGYCKSGKMLFSLVLESVSDFESTAKTAVEFAHAIHDNISSCIDTYKLTGDGFVMSSCIGDGVELELRFEEFAFAGRGLCSFSVFNWDIEFDSRAFEAGDTGHAMDGTYKYGSDNVFEKFKAWECINRDISNAIADINANKN